MPKNWNQIFLRVNDVAKRYGMSVPTVWRLTRQGDFPQAIKLSPGITAWSISDLVDWESKKAARSTNDRGRGDQ